MDTTWYYTLSTISQTLAATLGLGAVFLTLILQTLDKNINDYKERAIRILRIKKRHYDRSYDIPDKLPFVFTDIKEFATNYLAGYRTNEHIMMDVKRLAIQYEAMPYNIELPHFDGDIDFVINTLNNLDIFMEERGNVIKMIKWPGVIASSAIIFSLMCLALTDRILNQVLLFMITAWALVGFHAVVRASWKIINAAKKIA